MSTYVQRLSPKQRAAYRAEVAAALKAHKDSPQVLQAIERTARLLQYESHTSPAARWFTSRIREVRIRKHGKSPTSPYCGRYPKYSPRTMLARMLEHYAIVETQPWRFPTANAEHEALARAFLLTARGQHTDHLRWYRAAGKFIAHQLGAFAILFIRNNVAPLMRDEQQQDQHREPTCT
jgi:hypothetical protein